MARWWRKPADLQSIADKYAPRIDGHDPTEVFLIELDGNPIGLVQRYLLADNPEWAATLGIQDGAGIDYYIGEERLIGRGLGSRVVAQFAKEVLTRYPAAGLVVAAPQQDNVASWRALEKAGFDRFWAGQLASDDPSDAGPAYLYILRRST